MSPDLENALAVDPGHWPPFLTACAIMAVVALTAMFPKAMIFTGAGAVIGSVWMISTGAIAMIGSVCSRWSEGTTQ
jgi:hypothetical protein